MRKWSRWAGLAAALMLAGTARAALIQVTYEGLATRFQDGLALFGGLQLDLDDPLAVMAVFVIDTDLGQRDDTTFGARHEVRLAGGESLGIAGPVLSAALTIEGVTYQLRSGFRSSSVTGLTNGLRTVPEQMTHSADFSEPAGLGSYQEHLRGLLSGSAATVFDPALALIDAERSHQAEVGGVFGRIEFDAFSTADFSQNVNIRADMTRMSVVALPRAVPEPPAVALVLGCLAAAGLCMARRRVG